MALVHDASITPTKAEALTRWLPLQAWGPSADAAIELVGAYRFDDPEGEVGLETHVVRAGDELYQVPLTYRPAPLDDDAALVCPMEHTALGHRWVYDGLHDPVYVRVLAATAVTGLGQVVSHMQRDGRWVVAVPSVHLAGHALGRGLVDVDGLALESDDADWAVLGNQGLEVRFRRRLDVASNLGSVSPTDDGVISATWRGHADPNVLAVARLR